MKRVWFEDVMFPKCFDSPEQLESWRQAMLQAKNTSYTTWVCLDCTPSYQKKMIDVGRCENPHVQFRRDQEHKTYSVAKDNEWAIVGFVPDDVYREELEKRKVIQSKFLNQYRDFEMK